MCQILNLRGSSFTKISPALLYQLVYVDIAYSKIESVDFRPCLELVQVVRDEKQVVQVNDGVVVEEIYLPMKAPDGTEDTQKYYKVEMVSFARTGHDCTKFITLRDGTKMEFTHYSNYNSIKLIDCRNLIHCKYLNLGATHSLQSLDITYLKSLLALNIWGTSIKVIDLTELELLDVVICGYIFNTDGTGM